MSSTVYADSVPPVSERIKLKFVACHTSGDIACGTGACVTFLASVTCARSRSCGNPIASCNWVPSSSSPGGAARAAATTTCDSGQNSIESQVKANRDTRKDRADLLQHREFRRGHFADKSERHMVVLGIDPAAALPSSRQLSSHLSRAAASHRHPARVRKIVAMQPLALGSVSVSAGLEALRARSCAAPSRGRPEIVSARW